MLQNRAVLVFGTAGAHTNEDVGLTFPDDYGPITGFQWLEDDVVLVALANGYVTSVDFGAMVRMRQQHGLPEAVKATGTTKVFNDYLTCLAYSKEPHCRIACVGDKGFKVIVRKGADLEVRARARARVCVCVCACSTRTALRSALIPDPGAGAGRQVARL